MSNKREALNELLNRKPVNTKIQESVDSVIERGVVPNNKKKATYELDLDLHTELKIFAAKQNKKMVDIVELAIREYLRNNK
ncbi:hypothetical protein [Paenibacillus chibensis]|uniref:hypothetical protein n=1 Tax=Paenibacillus chibensis TaxID=59846 RepID=UPI000FD81341|nr:hypothetical protein [Paenibacillus chibensis]MEC0373322.1 hypothetical protein [Paenibacillus chibensis]